MTCIVGLETDDGVWIGGDSLGAGQHEYRKRADPKVFQIGSVLIGFTTSYRMGQLLRFRLRIPQQAAKKSDYEFLCTEFVDAVRRLFKNSGFATKTNEQESGGSFLVGYRGRLYEVDSDYQVGIPAHRYSAIGSGASVALGAMHVGGKLISCPETRVRHALEAAEEFSYGVRGPFSVLFIKRSNARAERVKTSRKAAKELVLVGEAN